MSITQTVVAFAVLYVKQIETSSHVTLDWFDISDGTENVGKMFMAVEAIRMADGLTETVNPEIVPLLKSVQPRRRVYQSVMAF